MTYPSLNLFLQDIAQKDPGELVHSWLSSGIPHAFSSSDDCREFLGQIQSDWPDSEYIIVAGTANWRFSLNPKKDFSEYHEKSDVDVVVISPKDFNETWERLRGLHRKRWYSWPKHLRDSVMRTGANVYCGFVSPKHIPDKANQYRFNFLTKCNSYSTQLVDHRDVNMMFFKSLEDARDYYVRGVRLAKQRI
ncbi:MAG: hypothetical protein P1U54_10245 [Immundisolibacteraceae bacterium]|nr:hypothetical protein [Immundisolibacteraceae bacterium]